MQETVHLPCKRNSESVSRDQIAPQGVLASDAGYATATFVGFPKKMQATRFRRLTSARYERSTLAKVDLLGVDTWLKECRLASIPWVAWKGWSMGLIVIALTVRFSLAEMCRQQRRTNGSLVESG